MPAYATAVGKAMLAFSPPATLAEVLAQGLARVGPNTITDEESLRNELKTVAAAGLAYEESESATGSSCVASPVLDSGGSLVASLSVSGSVGHLDIDRAAPAVRTAALFLGRQLPRNSALAQG